MTVDRGFIRLRFGPSLRTHTLFLISAIGREDRKVFLVSVIPRYRRFLPDRPAPRLHVPLRLFVSRFVRLKREGVPLRDAIHHRGIRTVHIRTARRPIRRGIRFPLTGFLGKIGFWPVQHTHADTSSTKRAGDGTECPASQPEPYASDATTFVSVPPTGPSDTHSELTAMSITPAVPLPLNVNTSYDPPAPPTPEVVVTVCAAFPVATM